MKVMITLDNVDWQLLRTQKAELVDMCAGNVLETHEVNAVDGIIHFLDHIQDQAAKVLGEEQVFGK